MKVTRKVHSEIAAIRRERSAAKAKASSAKKSSARKTAKKAASAKAAPVSVAGVLRLPAVGEKLTRNYKGNEIVVEAIKGGFRYEGETYTSLSALAKKITGYPAISGPAFFKLWSRKPAAEAK